MPDPNHNLRFGLGLRHGQIIGSVLPRNTGMPLRLGFAGTTAVVLS